MRQHIPHEKKKTTPPPVSLNNHLIGLWLEGQHRHDIVYHRHRRIDDRRTWTATSAKPTGCLSPSAATVLPLPETMEKCSLPVLVKHNVHKNQQKERSLAATPEQPRTQQIPLIWQEECFQVGNIQQIRLVMKRASVERSDRSD